MGERGRHAAPHPDGLLSFFFVFKCYANSILKNTAIMRHVVDKILDLFGECKASHNDIESCERNISCNDIGDKLTEFHQTLLKKESSVCKSLKCSKLPNGKEKDSSDDRTKIENNQQIDNDREVLSTNVESFTSGQKIKTAIVESANLYRMMAVSRLLVRAKKL